MCRLHRMTIFLTLLQLLLIPTYSVPFDEPHQDGKGIPKMKTLSTPSILRLDSRENGSEFWIKGGLDTLKKRLEVIERKGIAKNLILFLGDGMSIPTLAGARIYQGQREGKSGEESSLYFEKFPFTGLSKTYCVNSQVADSACSATAYLNGVKGNIETIGVTGAVANRDCEAMNEEQHHTSSIVSWAQAAGKATGLVTTTRVSHASPSGVYAHTASRYWEYDHPIAKLGKDPEKCWDITRQLVTNEPGKNLKVILGGGRGTFLPVTEKDPEYKNLTGWRTDKRNLIDYWIEDKKAHNLTAKFVWNRVELTKSEYDDSDYLLGLFEPGHMKYHMEADENTEPTLEEMTETAIKKLQKEDKGFFLFVEGGKIDLAHHFNFAEMAFDETIEFAKAIKKARELTDDGDTLIVVTADHAHTMSINGYPERGSDILTTLQPSDIDSLPYSTISYANGPGYKQNLTYPSMRYDLSHDVMNETHYQFPTLLPLEWETHGGDDVAVFANGPWAHLLVGNYEQNLIPLVMAYAARIGPSADIPFPKSSASLLNSNFYFTILTILFLFYFTFQHHCK
ncbi:membrane-bound alkaline phosphatase-like isoform X2 [Lycorma delicatula]